MAEPLVALLDAVGALGFLVAAFYGYQNWVELQSLSEYWTIFTVASGTGFFWASALTLEKLGYYSVIIDQAVGVLLATTATAFAISALIMNTSVVGPSR